jgi:hypothetical protein
MLLYPDRFEEFKTLAESTWRGLRIKELEVLPAEE